MTRLLSGIVFLSVLLAVGMGSRADSSILLVGHSDPASGSNRYADVWAEGNYAYVGSFAGTGVFIFDISIPQSPFLAAFYNPGSSGQFKDVVVLSGIGYFASDNGGGLHIVDLSDPTNPTLIRRFTAADGGYNSIHDLFYSNGLLYEADSRTRTVKVIDVSDPAAPFFVRDIVATDPRFIHDITVINNRLYTAGWGGKTDIYDVTNIRTQPPTLLGVIDSGTNSHSNWPTEDGRYLVSCREIANGDVRIFDISDPAHPVLVSTINAATIGVEAMTPHDPRVMGNLLFISWYQAGVQVFDIGDPTNPVYLGGYDTYPGDASGFAGCWGVYPFLGLDRVVASDLDGGLFILDATALSGQTDLLRNPDFERVPLPGIGPGFLPSEWRSLSPIPGADTYSIDGSFGLLPDAFGNFTGATAPSGVRWVAGGSSAPERFGQALTKPLAIGKAYALRGFLRAAKRAEVAHPGSYEVSLADNSLTSSLILGRFAPPVGNEDGWEERTLKFIAPDGADTHPILVFTPVGSPAGAAYPGLDSLSLANIPVLSGLTLAPSTVVGCKKATGKIILNLPAPPGGLMVALSSTNPAATVPDSVTIPAGKMSKTFPIATIPVTSTQTGRITARYGEESRSRTLTVRPIGVQWVTLTPNPAIGGTTVSGTVTLDCPAVPGDIVVRLSSSLPSVASPTVTTLTIPMGSRTGDFTVSTRAVSSPTKVNIHAAANGVRKSKTLTVNP